MQELRAAGVAGALILSVGAGLLLSYREPEISAASVRLPAESRAPSDTSPGSASREAQIAVAPLEGAHAGEALRRVALDPSERATVRYAALRRLDQATHDLAIEVAETLAKASAPEGDFLRTNAVALLVRSESPSARTALARVEAASPEAKNVSVQLKGGR